MTIEIRFDHLAKVLLLLLESERKGYTITVSQLLNKTGITGSVFYGSLKNKLEKSSLVVYRHNPDRTITVHLTEKGRRLAECLEKCRDVLE